MKRRDFLQLVGLAGVVATLPAPLQALVEGPLDEELTTTVLLGGKEIRIAEVRNIQDFVEGESILHGPYKLPGLKRQEIHLQLNWSPPIMRMFELDPVEFEINFEDISWKVKAHVKSFEWHHGREKDVCDVELVPNGSVEMVKK